MMLVPENYTALVEVWGRFEEVIHRKSRELLDREIELEALCLFALDRKKQGVGLLEIVGEFSLEAAVYRKRAKDGLDPANVVRSAMHQFSELIVEAPLYAQKSDGQTLRLINSQIFRLNKLTAKVVEIGFPGISLVNSKTGLLEVRKVLKVANAAKVFRDANITHATGTDYWFKELVEMRGLCKALLPWDGATILFRDCDVPSTEQIETILGLNQDSTEFAIEEAQRGGGRPRKQEEALAAYRKCFPHGHAGASWKAVMKTIRDATGFDGSEQTLQRALQAEA